MHIGRLSMYSSLVWRLTQEATSWGKKFPAQLTLGAHASSRSTGRQHLLAHLKLLLHCSKPCSGVSGPSSQNLSRTSLRGLLLPLCSCYGSRRRNRATRSTGYTLSRNSKPRSVGRERETRCLALRTSEHSTSLKVQSSVGDERV